MTSDPVETERGETRENMVKERAGGSRESAVLVVRPAELEVGNAEEGVREEERGRRGDYPALIEEAEDVKER